MHGRKLGIEYQPGMLESNSRVGTAFSDYNRTANKRCGKPTDPPDGNSESQQFEELYGFLSREDRQRLKKSVKDEREFLDVMRSLRQNSSSSRASNMQLIHFPRSVNNLKKFMDLLKERSEVESALAVLVDQLESSQPVKERIESIDRLFQLTREFDSDGKKNRRATPHQPKPEQERRKLMIFGQDEGNNPDAAFKKLARMSIGLEQYSSSNPAPLLSTEKGKSAHKKTTILKAKPPKEKQARPSTTAGNFIGTSSIPVTKSRMKAWQQKLIMASTQPIINFRQLRPQNYNRMHREISCLVGRANKLYGLKLNCPKQLDFTDEQLRNEVANIKPSFLINRKSTKATTAYRPIDKENDTVPIDLLKTLEVSTSPKRQGFQAAASRADYQYKTLHF